MELHVRNEGLNAEVEYEEVCSATDGLLAHLLHQLHGMAPQGSLYPFVGVFLCWSKTGPMHSTVSEVLRVSRKRYAVRLQSFETNLGRLWISFVSVVKK